MQLEPGHVSEPIENGGGLYIASALEREPAIVPRSPRSKRWCVRTCSDEEGMKRFAPISTTLRTQTAISVDESLFESDVQAATIPETLSAGCPKRPRGFARGDERCEPILDQRLGASMLCINEAVVSTIASREPPSSEIQP